MNSKKEEPLIKNLDHLGIAGLKQKLSPNEAETGFIGGKHVTIMG